MFAMDRGPRYRTRGLFAGYTALAGEKALPPPGRSAASRQDVGRGHSGRCERGHRRAFYDPGMPGIVASLRWRTGEPNGGERCPLRPNEIQGFAAKEAQTSSLSLRANTWRLAYAGGTQANRFPEKGDVGSTRRARPSS